MAVLAVAGLGALGSSALGLGWQAGWLIGSAVGSAFFGPKIPDQFNEGPRLQDLNVTSSAYGAPIPKVYGTMRLNGNVIWAQDLIEEKNESAQSTGGKGGGGGTIYTTTYSYFANFAVAFAEGPADNITRIWADTTLIYDTTGTGSYSEIDGLNFRFYPGSEDQLPDPLIQSVQGAANTPAHRGIAYMVFERLPLQKFGNRIPNITVELAFSADQVQPFIQTNNFPAGVTPTDVTATDFVNNRIYVLGSDNKIYRINAKTMQIERNGQYAFPKTVHSIDVGPDGNLAVSEGNTSSVIRYAYSDHHKVSSTTLKPIASYIYEGSTEFNINNIKSVGIGKWEFIKATWKGGVRNFAVGMALDWTLDSFVIYDYDRWERLEPYPEGGDGEFQGLGNFGFVSINRIGISELPPITDGKGGGQFFLFDSDLNSPGTSVINVYKGFLQAAVSAPGELWYFDYDLFATIGVDQFAGDANAYRFISGPDDVYRDPLDNNFIIGAEVRYNNGSENTIYVKWSPVDGIVWRSFSVPRSGLPEYVDFSNATIGNVTRGQDSFSINSSTGVRFGNQDWDGIVSLSQSASTYFSLENAVVARGSTLYKLFLNRLSNDGTSLEAIVGSLCADAGLQTSDYDASELSGIDVDGYVVTRTMPLRSALEPLATAYFFDVVESDGILKFKIRGSDPVETITDDFLLLRNESGSRVEERRAMEVELPSRFSVVYSNTQSDYLQGTQSAQRIATTNSSRNQVNIELPVALSNSKARQIAEKALASAWNGRTTLDFTTTLDFLKLDPTDVVNVLLDDGTNYLVRLTDLEVGADYSISIKCVTEYAASYVSDIDGGESEGFKPQTAAGDPATEVILPDMPLLQDIDDLNGRATRLYSFTSGFDESNWVGSSTFISNDGGSSWERLVSNNESLPWGIAVNTLPAPTSPFKTDEQNQLIVQMETYEDQLESITQLQMLNNGNPALLLTAEGNPEIIQFRDVTFNADGTVTFSGLLRGRRGTDVFCGDHQIGDIFVLLNNVQGEAFSLPISELNTPLDIKVVPTGQTFETTPTLSKTYTGRDLKPYAPVNFSASLQGDGSVTLGWFRRTRLGGDLRDDLSEVPLAESFERYDIEILDVSGDVLRTYSDVTTSTMSYPAVDYETDFPSGTNVLTFRVYQKSEIVGRGFPGEETVEVL